MTKAERSNYINKMKLNYSTLGKRDKSRLLDEFCKTCDIDRKYAIHILNEESSRIKKKPGPFSKYNNQEFISALTTIWLTSNKMCSKKLKQNIPKWLPFLSFPLEMNALLLTISPSTIDTLLKQIRD